MINYILWISRQYWCQLVFILCIFCFFLKSSPPQQPIYHKIAEVCLLFLIISHTIPCEFITSYELYITLARLVQLTYKRYSRKFRSKIHILLYFTLLSKYLFCIKIVNNYRTMYKLVSHNFQELFWNFLSLDLMMFMPFSDYIFGEPKVVFGSWHIKKLLWGICALFFWELPNRCSW